MLFENSTGSPRWTRAMSFCKSEASYLDDDYGGDVYQNDDEAGDGGDVDDEGLQCHFAKQSKA